MPDRCGAGEAEVIGMKACEELYSASPLAGVAW